MSDLKKQLGFGEQNPSSNKTKSILQPGCLTSHFCTVLDIQVNISVRVPCLGPTEAKRFSSSRGEKSQPEFMLGAAGKRFENGT